MKTNLLFIFLAFSGIVSAQWQNTNALSPQTNCVATSGTNVFSGRAGGGVEGSIDGGNSWTICCSNGMTYSYIWSLLIDGTNIFATTGRGVYLSIDSARSWTQISNGLSATTTFDTTVYSIIKSGTNFFAGTAGTGIYISSNYGSSWNAVNNGLTNQNVRALASDGVNIFAGTSGAGVFLSTNSGTSWTAVNNGLTNGNIRAIAIDGENVYVGTSGGGIFLSTNNGGNWTAINSGLLNFDITALVIHNGIVYSGTAGGVYLSRDNGANWTAENSGFTNTNISGLSISGANIFASIYMGGVWRRSLSEMVGVKEIDVPIQFNISPNPLTSETTFQTDNPLHNATLKVVNNIGQTVKQITNINGQTVTLHRDNLQSGMYFITLTEDNKIIATRKIIITD